MNKKIEELKKIVWKSLESDKIQDQIEGVRAWNLLTVLNPKGRNQKGQTLKI